MAADKPCPLLQPSLELASGWDKALTVHIEDFTRARVNESDLTAVLVETGAMPVPTKSRNPTACAWGGSIHSYLTHS